MSSAVRCAPWLINNFYRTSISMEFWLMNSRQLISQRFARGAVFGNFFWNSQTLTVGFIGADNRMRSDNRVSKRSVCDVLNKLFCFVGIVYMRILSISCGCLNGVSNRFKLGRYVSLIPINTYSSMHRTTRKMRWRREKRTIPQQIKNRSAAFAVYLLLSAIHSFTYTTIYD